MASLSQGRTAAAQCSLFTYKSVPVIFEPPCTQTTSLFQTDRMFFTPSVYSLVLSYLLIAGAVTSHCVITAAMHIPM